MPDNTVPGTALPSLPENFDLPPPMAPPSSIPSVNLLPPTPITSQEEKSAQSTLLEVPDTTLESSSSAPTRNRSRSQSPAAESSLVRRSPRLASPAPATKRPASDPLDEPVSKKPKGK
jgi:hypothetical protein